MIYVVGDQVRILRSLGSAEHWHVLVKGSLGSIVENPPNEFHPSHYYVKGMWKYGPIHQWVHENDLELANDAEQLELELTDEETTPHPQG